MSKKSVHTQNNNVKISKGEQSTSPFFRATWQLKIAEKWKAWKKISVNSSHVEVRPSSTHGLTVRLCEVEAGGGVIGGCLLHAIQPFNYNILEEGEGQAVRWRQWLTDFVWEAQER